MKPLLIILIVLSSIFLLILIKIKINIVPKHTVGDLIRELDAKDYEAKLHGYKYFMDKYYRAEELPDGSIAIYTKNDLKSNIEERIQ